MSGGPGISKLTPVGHNLPCPNEVNPDKLSLAPEPEVAAIYSQQVTAKEVIEAGTSSFQKPKGNYMVLDIGDKTINIAAEVADGVEVISPPMGNDWGGIQVNEQFSKMLERIVSDPGFSRFLSSGDQSQHRAVLNKLLYHEFELHKNTFGDGKMYGEMPIDLPRDIVQFYRREKIEDGAKRIDGVEFDNDTLYIKSKVVEENLFGPPVNRIVEFILTMLHDLDHHIDTMYLLGKFGGCKFLHQKLGTEIRKKLGETSCRIIVPTSPKLAITTGAVMWRKNPDLIKARRADATYGIGVTVPFDEEKHDSYYRFYDEEQQCFKCRNVFEIFLQKGQKVTADEVFTATIIPSHQSQTIIQLDVYSTPNFGVQYITDKDGKMNVIKIGQLILDIPNPDNLSREERIVDVTMRLIGTEIQVKAKYRVNGREVTSVMDILSAHIY